jgi:hypothetical protein
MNTTKTVRTVFTEAGAVLRNLETGASFSINLVGSKIWQLLTKGTTRDEIVEQLSSEFHLTRGQLCHDVDEFLTLLEQRGLLQKEVSKTQ